MFTPVPICENPRRSTKNRSTFQTIFIYVFIGGLIFTSLFSVAQPLTKKAFDKTAPGFAKRIEEPSKDSNLIITIQLKSMKEWNTCAGFEKKYEQLYWFEPTKTLVIKASKSFIKNILQCDAVLFADDVKKPKEELLLGFVDYSINNSSLLQTEFPQYNGASLSVSVKEDKYDTTDIDFKGRIFSSSFASTTVSSHASAMATIIAGGGNTWNYTKGAAWGSTLSSATFQNLLPEPINYYQQSNISLQNHSYGTVVEHFYGAEAAAYDASINLIPTLVHIFSIGNSGTVTPAAGRYSGIAGYANITGNFKQGKNNITVGHLDSFFNVLSPSSKGPAYDGRVKPELVAFGEDGSSGAAALVSGIALTLQHAYKQLNSNMLPSAALIKSVLLNSANDVGAIGIDFASGYGNANGYKAMQTIVKSRFFNGSVSNNASQNFSITIPPGIKQLKLTLCYTDIAAPPNSTKALVNDLDMVVQNNSTLQTWLPWVLNSFPHKDSLLLLPVQKKDTLNTVEQITVDDPAAGIYTITVKGSTVSTGTQAFAIAWQLDSSNTFKWYYPSKNDHLIPPDSNVLRWQSTYTTSTAQLELSTNNGNSWQTIDNNVNLAKGYYKYAPPPINQPALLRMKVGTDIFVSDTFTISKRLLTNVGFNCVDSFLINWQKIPGITQYQIYKLGNQYLEPLLVTTDTFLVQSKAGNSMLHYAIAPLASTKPLLHSYTFNYTTQGSGCYIRSFFANLTVSNSANLQLLLSSTIGIKTIVFEKRTATGFVSIEAINTINGLQYQFIDAAVKPGTNIYRAYVLLTDGRKFYSDESIIYLQGNNAATIYPNPVLQNGHITLVAKPEEQFTFQLINTNGSVVLQQLIDDFPEQIKLFSLQPGMYYYRLLKENKKVQSGKLIIQ